MNEQANTIKNTVATLLSSLNNRNRDVISRRFGLKTGKRETLESIGQSYDITRERVRQIEEASLASIREDLQGESKEKTEPFVKLAGEIIAKGGNVMREDMLFSAFSGIAKDNPANAALSFILTLDGRYHRASEDDAYRAFWSLTPVHAKAFKEQVATLTAALGAHNAVVPEAELSDFSKSKDLKFLSPETLKSMMAISKSLDKNVFGEFGLASWAEIHPRGVRDKSYLVLKKEGKPKHFREIAQLINDARFSDHKAHVQTVHNELIKDNRFVLVGRGTYALAQWGYTPGTVKEVIADLLRQKGPMPRDQIVAEVMSARLVKPNTVLLGIQDRSRFKEENGRVSLKEV